MTSYRGSDAAGSMPPKVAGEHRWVTFATFTVKDPFAASPANPALLDRENLVAIMTGCWDCEQPFGASTTGPICPAGDEWEAG